MKQEMKRLKGMPLSTTVGQLVLKQYFRVDQSQYDQIYFYCSQDFLLCKIYNLENQNSTQRYQREKQVYSMGSYPSLARFLSKTQFQSRKIDYGVIVLDNIPKSSSLIEVGNSLSFFQLLHLTKSILSLIKQLKNRNEVYLNLKPQNIYLDTEKNFIVINPQFICSKGNRSSVQQSNQFFFGNVQKHFKYCSPQVLDNYTYFHVDYKSDIFSLGCILYQTIYGKYPFESKFANINIIYEIQEGFFGKFIQKIFKPYKQRSQVQQLEKVIQEQLKKNPTQPKQTNTSSTNQSKSSIKNAPSILDDISSVFNKYTKQSQGAYINYTQDTQSFPQSKHLNFILNKLQKNPNKVEKLQSIFSKHIKMTQIGKRKNFLIKNLVLILQILRRNRNYMVRNWKQNILQIKQTLEQNDHLIEFCNILQKKIQLQEELNCIFRGNFYLEDVCQFKLLTINNNLQNMTRYLQTIVAFSGKLLLYKEDNYLFHYVLEIVCDEIYDLISMIILSVICIRKDNQFGLRKDNLAELTPIEKSLAILLKRISNLSTKISSHAIYSIQSQYYNYKEDIYLNQNPSYTSFEYFTKYCRNYKGLSIPENNIYSSGNGQKKQFNSLQLLQKGVVQENNKKFFYGNQISSDQDQSPTILNQIHPQQQSTKKSQINEKQKVKSIPNMPENKKITLDNLFGNNFMQHQSLKKTNSSKDQQNVISLKKSQIKSPTHKSGFDEFSNFFVEATQKSQKPPNLPTQPKNTNLKTQNNKSAVDLFQDFSFFQDQASSKKPEVKKTQQNKNDKSINLMNFNEPSNKSPSKKQASKPIEKQPIIKIDQNVLNVDIFNFQWLKNASQPQNKAPSNHQNQKMNNSAQQQQPKCQHLSPFVTEIVNSLKLKQLKDLIISNKEIAIQFQNLVFQKVIGSGSAGEVYLGKYGNQSIAIKKVKIKQNPNALKQFQRELVTYIKIKKNPYLVSLVGLSKSGEDFYLITQFCSAGSLFDLLHKKAGQIHLTWKTKMSLIIQIAKGMKALHEMKPSIIHRDLKSLNVFISLLNNEWIAKVADFGLSRSPEAQMMTMALGTLHWMAPQLLDNKQYSLKVDVYSFAIVMWQICARKTPYYELSNPMAIMKYVTIEKKRPNIMIIDPNCPSKLLQLIQLCWDQDPSKRPYFPQILEALTQIDKIVPSNNM